MKLKMKRLLIFSIILTSISGYLNAQDTTDVTTRPDTIPQGQQGSVNPLSEHKEALTGDALLDDSFPASWPLFGTGIRLKIGGYVKSDFIKDFDYIGDPYEFELGSIAVEGTPERDLGGRTTFHSKESRISFDVRNQAKWKNGKEFPMQVFIEIDWFFDSPSMALNTRLRHAYGVIGRLLVGRTWTTSGDLTAIPGLIDFAGGDALYGGRVTQIKWQDKIGKQLQYALSIEEPGAEIDNPNNFEGGFRPVWANFAGMIRYKSDNSSTIQLGADVFPTSWKGAGNLANTDKVGFALTLMSRVNFKATKYYDAFLWGGGYGHGQAHKIIALSWDGKASGAITPDGLHLNPAWFAYAGVNHYWNKNLNSTVSVHWTNTELNDFQDNSTIREAGSFHANLVWFPYKMVSTGIEYMYGFRENKNGVSGDASRIQFMVKYKFN